MKNITKNQKSLAIVSIVLVSMFVCATIFGTKTVYAVVPVPNIAIEPTAEKPYVLETPFGEYDFYIGKYSNNSYYAINMSNWNNYIINTNISYIVKNCSGSGSVVIQLGEFTTSQDSPLEIDADDVLLGSGIGKTILSLSNGANCPVIQTVGGYYGVGSSYGSGATVANLEIDGNAENQVHSIGDSGIILTDVKNFRIYDCYIHDCIEHGIWVIGGSNNCSDGLIYNNIIVAGYWNGITLGGSGTNSRCYNSIASNNIISLSADAGISIFGDNNKVDNNIVYDIQGSLGYGDSNSGWGLCVERGNYNTFSNNKIINCDVGFGVTSDKNNFYTNSFDSVDGDCYYIESCTQNIINGAISTNTFTVVNLANATYTTVMNIVCNDATFYALRTDSDCDYNYFVNCDLYNSDYNFNNDGSNTQCGYNRWLNGTYNVGLP